MEKEQSSRFLKLGLFNNQFYNKKILIVGNTGFKGSWLSLWLNKLGANVFGLSISEPSTPSVFELLNLKKSINQKFGDIRNKETIETIIQEKEPDLVFNLAAFPLVKDGFTRPYDTFSTNISSVWNILDAIKGSSVKSFIHVSSDKCYQNNGSILNEESPLGGMDPYGVSKACSEFILNSYRSLKNFKNIDISSVRAANVIGGGDFKDTRLIPDTIKALQENKSITLRNPKSVRTYIHIFDCLSGYLWLASNMLKEPNKFASNWNFGSYTVSTLNMVESLSQTWGNSYNISHQPAEYTEAEKLILESSKAKSKLKWNPTLTFEESIQYTSEWYAMYYLNKEMTKYSEDQLEKYIYTALDRNECWATEKI